MSSKLRTAAFIISALMMPLAASAADTADTTAANNGDSKPVAAMKDTAVTAKVKAKLAEARAGYTKSVHVKTTPEGVVTLTGTALTKDDADQAVAIAKGTDGVKSVVNKIKITK